jgi:DNA polymerase III alpha subunit
MDVDLDFQDRDQALNVLKHIKASRIDDQKLVPHNTGIYLQSIPYDPITNLASIDYKTAEQRGYFKLDFLNVNVYKGVRDEEHLKQLMEATPLWDLLEQDDFSNLLFHIHGHGNILRAMKPDTVEKLAAVLAMIRPAKRHLIGKTWDEVFAEIWIRPENGEYFFKKSHGIAYAMAIIVQMNLICEQISYGYN